MISIELQIEEIAGRVEIRMVAPPQPSATQKETAHASTLCAGIRQTLQAIQNVRGAGILIEKSTVNCPKCKHQIRKEPGVGLYTCPECGQAFGA